MWEESLSDQLPSSAVVTFLSVVNAKPRPAGLVVPPFDGTSFRPFSGLWQEQAAIPFLRLVEQTVKLAIERSFSGLRS